MTPEQKELLDKLRDVIGLQKKFDDAMTAINAHFAEKGVVPELRKAVEEIRDEHKRTFADLQARLAAVQREITSPRGEYRGSFRNATVARAFALFVMCKSLATEPELHQRYTAMFKEHTDIYQRANSPNSGETGLIGEEFSPLVVRLVENYSSFKKLATTIPMTTESLNFTRSKVGMRAHKTKLRALVAQQVSNWSKINLLAEDYDILAAYPIPYEEDSLLPIAEMLVQDMGYGFAIALEQNGLVGNGTAAYDNEVGIAWLLQQAAYAASKVTVASGNGWPGVTEQDLLNLMSKPRFIREGMGTFVCSQEFYWTVMAPIVLNKNGVTVQQMEDGPHFMFAGRPVEISPAMTRASASTDIPVIYGDIGLSSAIGNRKGIEVRVSREVFFQTKEVAILMSSRWGISNHTLGDAVTPGPVAGLYTN